MDVELSCRLTCSETVAAQHYHLDTAQLLADRTRRKFIVFPRFPIPPNPLPPRQSKSILGTLLGFSPVDVQIRGNASLACYKRHVTGWRESSALQISPHYKAVPSQLKKTLAVTFEICINRMISELGSRAKGMVGESLNL